MSTGSPRIKWHMLRRRKSDPPFQRENLIAALTTGAACEVDIVISGDGHALCLHDLTLDRETTGRGEVRAHSRHEIERLRQRGSGGEGLSTAPLFLDQVVDAVRQHGAAAASVQLDMKARLDALTPMALGNLRELLNGVEAAFIVSAYDWPTVTKIRATVPGIHVGFDPLALYPRSLDLDAEGFCELARATLETAPEATIYYLEARLLVAAWRCGVNLVQELGVRGAGVDAWTVDLDRPNLEDLLKKLLALGVTQITSNDAEGLERRVARLTARR